MTAKKTTEQTACFLPEHLGLTDRAGQASLTVDPIAAQTASVNGYAFLAPFKAHFLNSILIKLDT